VNKVRIDNLDHEQALDPRALETATGGKNVGRGLLKQSDDTLDGSTEKDATDTTSFESTASFTWLGSTWVIMMNRCETVMVEAE
jgi:hypothetical protein